MISSRIALATLLAFMMTAGGTASAGRRLEYEIDSEHSTVLFKIMNRDISFIYGRFKMISGTISTNHKTKPTEFEMKVEVKPHSVDTNSRERDKKLKSKEFFYTSKFKTITFESKETKKLEDNKFELIGELTLMGKTLPLTVVFELTGAKSMGKGEYRMGGQTTFSIKRSEFGLDALIPEVADEVTVIISLEGKRKVVAAG